MRRLVGPVLIVIGGVHIALGARVFAGPLAAIGRDGVVGAVDSHPEREAAFWYLMTGATLVVLGDGARRTHRDTGTLPASLGPGLAAIATAGVVAMPKSGFWSLFVPAALALLPERRDGGGVRT